MPRILYFTLYTTVITN